MNKKYIALVASIAVSLTAACGTPPESVSAPSSSSAAAPSSGSAVQEYRKAQSEEWKREMRLHVEAGIPHDVDRRYAEAASKDGVPFAFSYGEGCTWVRLPDKTLWSLNRDGGPLTRDIETEKRFGSWPGAGPGEGRPCSPAVDIPAADDPSSPGPFRWIGERGFQRLRVNGAVYALPAEVPESGMALRDAVDHGPAPTSGEVVPGVPSTYPN
ncbi:hypothetical protein [Mycolicibacterium fortuitum]|uniref:hypothetical protein n=1 Tax=Mycolicibacterium fortuitum TaxID=1766 RepID=UPI0007E9FA64|nr:hypothetical protein [Mycolicibacterium fortuitum]NOQ58422.1 hypothetical protein [Mycolicibacterium fortuitum]OBB40008.1 hypothetical protein A5763_04300 [Mycolicibacterium fortuitum]OBG09550.1 hypothetical protein A5768_15290 [Mycolicibacterium fortuitum]